MRLLFVEDYPPLQKSLAKGLREAGFAVDVTGNGDEALWYALGNDYDIIILDLMLPGMDGLTVLKKLRAKGRQTHILVLTARSEVADRVKGLDCGADDYLVKPFAFEELIARINALLRREYQQKTASICSGDLRIDTSAKRVWRGREELQLTAREYALLEYLARRQGQVVSRTDIWEHVYDFHSTATSNVVDVYVGYLRKKIDPPDGNGASLIATVRGRGYMFGPQP
jgi:DNA-binding response OmpR family regulator